jgi:4-carboxymuconolactone decarboxylase
MSSARRLDKIDVESLDDDQRALYESIAGGPRANSPFRLADEQGRLEGPFNAFLLQPRLGDALQGLGAAVRYQTSLSGRAREIAILTVAAHTDSTFEWYAHEAVGRVVGLTDPELDALRHQRRDVFDGDERVVASVAHDLVSTGDLDDDAYAEAVAVLGTTALFELTTLVGYYTTLALQLRVFRVGAPTP